LALQHGFKLLTLSLLPPSLPLSLSFISTALSLQDALVANYPKLASDEKNSFVREELEIFL
jgi:hypothetical protein